MRNKKMMVGIAAGAVALSVAALIIAKRRARKAEFKHSADEAKEHFKSKLNELQRKARKEYKNSASETKEVINNAKERATDWVNKANA